jgi:glycosyltransferase involved in cell wall biosynthesis
MKVIHITPGLIQIPPNGWGAVEKIIWEFHKELLSKNIQSVISYLDYVDYKSGDIVHIHVANLALIARKRGIPYYFTCHDHHAYLYGKDSVSFKENYEAIKYSIQSFVPSKYLVDYFNHPKLEYVSHGVNVEWFKPSNKIFTTHKLLCVANNGFIHDQSEDRKGFLYAIEAAKNLNIPITIVGPINNKKFFDKFNPQYDKLSILYNVSEEELLNVYQDHTLFIHPSALEAGHPNLTLLEAMSCGLPVVGTFEENNSLLGLYNIERTTESVTAGIKHVIQNYDKFRIECLNTAKEKSWSRITNLLINYYNKKNCLMSLTLREKSILIILLDDTFKIMSVEKFFLDKRLRHFGLKNNSEIYFDKDNNFYFSSDNDGIYKGSFGNFR